MRIRPLTEADKLTIAAMIARDPEHSAKGMRPEFFFADNGTLSICCEDDHGPVFFMRLDPSPPESIRIHIQFDEDLGMAIRTAKTLIDSFDQVTAKCRRMPSCKRIVFESMSESLRRFFCRDRFGFRPVAGTADLELWLK